MYQVGIGQRNARRPQPLPRRVVEKRSREARAMKRQQLVTLRAIAANEAHVAKCASA
jgi:hypothetical protein